MFIKITLYKYFINRLIQTLNLDGITYRNLRQLFFFCFTILIFTVILLENRKIPKVMKAERNQKQTNKICMDAYFCQEREE